MLTRKKREELTGKAKAVIDQFLFSPDITDEELDYLFKKLINEAVDCLVYDDDDIEE